MFNVDCGCEWGGFWGVTPKLRIVTYRFGTVDCVLWNVNGRFWTVNCGLWIVRMQ